MFNKSVTHFNFNNQPKKFSHILQEWLEALEEHSAYSTHYCSQEQGSEEEEEEEEVMSLGRLTDSLQVAFKKNP